MRKLPAFLSLCALFIIVLIFCIYELFQFSPNYPITALDDGWTVLYHNEKYINTNLEMMSKQVGLTFSRGDTVTLTQSKPIEIEDLPFPYLLFKTQFCAFEVFLDNQLINEKYLKELSEFKYIGIGYHAIELPKDSSGKKLTVKLYISENNTRADLVTPLIGDFDDLYRYLFHSEMFPFISGLFLMVFGFISLIISFLFYIRSAEVETQIICSLINITLGTWILSAYSTMGFFLEAAFVTMVEYLALYSLVPLMYLLLYNLHPRYNNSVLIFITITSVLFDILFFVLHFMNLVHINHFQYPYYMMSAIGIVTLCIYLYFDFRNRVKNFSTMILMLGLSALVLSLLVYEVVALSHFLVDYRQISVTILIIPSGSLFFVIVQLLNYFIYMTRSYAQKEEFASLSQVAYIDNLTGIHNRVSCDQKLNEIGQTDADFTILSLDLNGLKEVNDNSGHPAGDRLLKSFADCLLSVFEDTGSSYRIGGDEFLVLFESIEDSKLDEMLHTLDERLLLLDKDDPEINHSVSYGYAKRSETEEKDTHSVVMLADKRMYDYKRKFYSHLMHR